MLMIFIALSSILITTDHIFILSKNDLNVLFSTYIEFEKKIFTIYNWFQLLIIFISIFMNRFQRAASNYAYYGYLTRYSPESLRTYQSQRFFSLGRRAAYDTLVLKMAADHVNFEDDMNQYYKTPTVLSNLIVRVGWFLFVVPIFMMFFNFDDMIRIFVPHKYSYIGNQSDPVIPTRY